MIISDYQGYKCGIYHVKHWCKVKPKVFGDIN